MVMLSTCKTMHCRIRISKLDIEIIYFNGQLPVHEEKSKRNGWSVTTMNSRESPTYCHFNSLSKEVPNISPKISILTFSIGHEESNSIYKPKLSLNVTSSHPNEPCAKHSDINQQASSSNKGKPDDILFF